VAVEEAARQQRAQGAPVSRRVDGQQPMYSSSRPSHGSGALDGWTVLMLLTLLVAARRLRQGV
jgi:Ca-activated chloride channel family protein